MTRVAAPQAVLDAARRRSEARAARDWATADELRGEIEAAGWRITDSGTEFRLVPAHPADREVEGEIRYGRSDAVPSRLDEPPTAVATVVMAVERGDPVASASVAAAARHLPAGVELVVVGDALDDTAADAIRDVIETPTPDGGHELVRTSAPLGRAAALNAGIRRATGAVVVVLDSSVQLTGDAVSPLVAALELPEVAVAGPFGLETSDLRRFEEVLPPAETPVEATAIEGYCMAFRRSDYVERGPLDEGFRFYRNLDVWWSLVLRDALDAGPPRRALAVPNLPVTRSEPWAWTSTPPRERDRLSKRNFYRVLDRFRERADLVVPATVELTS